MSKEQRPMKPVRRVTVFAIYEDTEGDAPRTWTVMHGTAPLDAITPVEVIPNHNAGVAPAFLVRWVDEMELLS